MLELGNELVNKSDIKLRPLEKRDFYEFRRAATESTESNYEYLAYGALFENLNIFDFSRTYSAFLEDKNYEHWGVFHRKTLIGHIGFSFGSGPLSAEVIGWVRKGYQSQGIGEIGLQTACAIAFQFKSFNYVELRIQESNRASRRAAEKVGFVPILKLGSLISGTPDPYILYVKINPEIVSLAEKNRLRPIDIMNSPASRHPMRYMLRNRNLLDFYGWPFPSFKEDCTEVDFFEYHGYMALLSFTPDELERLLEEPQGSGDGVY
jgi:RimJ/RimL family protein N-acetyltransferase